MKRSDMERYNDWAEYLEMKLKQALYDYRAAISTARMELGAIFSHEIACNEGYMYATTLLEGLSVCAREMSNEPDVKWIINTSTGIFMNMHSELDVLECIERSLRITIYYDVICPLYGLGYIDEKMMKTINSIRAEYNKED